MKPLKITLLMATSTLLMSACAVAPAMSEQEAQIKTDLAVDHSLPATRQMRDAIETQPIFAQAAFWSSEYDLNPADLESAIKLSAAVRKLGNPNRAVEITQTTRALYPRDPYLVAEYAASLIAAERAVDAMQPLDEALAMTPAYGRLWSLKGAALDQQERYNEARQFYNRALQITPNDPNVLANIGFSYALSGDAVTAEKWLRRAMAQPSASPSVRQNLALVLRLQGRIEESEKLLALTQAPQSFQFEPQVQAQPQPALRGKITPSRFAQPQAGQPQARVLTGATAGQRFSSASEAARAMAAQKSGQIARQNIGPVSTGTTNGGQVSPEAQQAVLERIAQARNLTPQPVQPQQQATAPYASPHPGYYPNAGVLAGAPVVQQQANPERREANRRRR